ncbi:hypothetical protein PCIT_a1170 [Pseudoalteromonas citrea]|uniref:Uncharacterized protein n=2 Tax=Pseudoalteromonas citrea TaxID=43655 RepID=A0AAD4ALR9_9GAMM|nr:hypothetical protein [Pseudoalteromonas citrea]KAF7775071.1 hypothetical protein PCIT_a1170 [Pseudoalteromonas citrea]
MIAQQPDLFNSCISLYKLFGANIHFENGKLDLTTEVNLTDEHIVHLTNLFNNRRQFRSFALEIDWCEASINDIVAGRECNALKVEFELYAGNSFSFYKNEHDLFSKLSSFLIQGKKLPERYYFTDDDYRSDGDTVLPAIIKLKELMEWIKFLTAISDIDKHTNTGVTLYFFIKGEDDKYAKPLEISICNISELLKIEDISTVEDISKLISKDEHGNLHHQDRQSFFKLALVDTLKKLVANDTTEKSNTEILFTHLDKVKSAYYEHYEVFIHNFAIGEFQQQVEEKGFDYAEKVSSVLNDIQIRLYAIPIVLVSLGALSKVDNAYSYFFVISGVVITALFNYWMINDQILRLKQIEKSCSFTFDKLKNQCAEKLESKAMMSNLDDIVNNIKIRITDRNTKIKYYKALCWAPTLIALILLVVKESASIEKLFSFNLNIISQPVMDTLKILYLIVRLLLIN